MYVGLTEEGNCRVCVCVCVCVWEGRPRIHTKTRWSVIYNPRCVVGRNTRNDHRFVEHRDNGAQYTRQLQERDVNVRISRAGGTTLTDILVTAATRRVGPLVDIELQHALNLLDAPRICPDALERPDVIIQ